MSTVGDWLFLVAAKKGLTQMVVALLTLIGADHLGGIDLETSQKVLIAVGVGLLNVLRNWLKIRMKLRFL